MRSGFSGIIVAVFFLVAAGSLTGCKQFGLKDIGIDLGRTGDESGGAPRRRGHIGRGKGPPEHAPAHGSRDQREYRYYPDSDVYYDEGASVYFYLDDGKWRMKARLPRRLRIKLGEFVEIELEGDKPYAHHKKHKRQYPPGQREKWKKREKHK